MIVDREVCGWAAVTVVISAEKTRQQTLRLTGVPPSGLLAVYPIFQIRQALARRFFGKVG